MIDFESFNGRSATRLICCSESHGRYSAFQMAEVAIPRHMFQEFCGSLPELRLQPPPPATLRRVMVMR